MPTREGGHCVVYAGGTWKPGLFPLLLAVILHLDDKHDDRRDCRDGIRDNQRPIAQHQSLDHEKNAAETKKKESGHRYALGVARADSVDSLWQIAANHADCSCIAYDIDEEVRHNGGVLEC